MRLKETDVLTGLVSSLENMDSRQKDAGKYNNHSRNGPSLEPIKLKNESDNIKREVSGKRLIMAFKILVIQNNY